MNLNENHLAAGVSATTARQTAKSGWKDGIVPHVVIGITAFIIGVVVLNNYELNLFWKLLAGYGLIWGGGKISATKNTVAVTWGKATTAIGWVIIALALLNSGVRQVAEKAVIWTDQSLTELSGGKSGQAGEVFKSIMPEKSIISEVDFRRAPEGHTIVADMTLTSTAVVRMSMGHVSTGPNWACPKVIRPVSLPFTPEFEIVAGNNTVQIHFKLTEESQEALLKNGTMSVSVIFVHTTAHENPCLTVRKVR